MENTGMFVVYEVVRENYNGQPVSMGLFLYKEHAQAVITKWNAYGKGLGFAELYIRTVYASLPDNSEK